MFEIFKNVILSKNYKLEDMLLKINILWAEGSISDDERLSLISLARDNALAENSYKPLQEQLDNLYKAFNDFKAEVNARLNVLEGKEDIEEPVEEYPPFVKPEGAHDAYQKGACITFNGEKYESLIDNNVWAPDVYPQGWKKVEETENTEIEEV